MHKSINDFQKKEFYDEVNKFFPDKSQQAEFYLDNQANRELTQFLGKHYNFIAQQKFNEIKDRETYLSNKFYKETIKEVYQKV